MLFMLMFGRDCCCGAINDGLPMPGFVALNAGKEEFSELSVLSGVMVRLCALGADKFVCGGGDTGGVDQENVAAGDALFDLTRLVEGRDGKIVEEVAEADAFAHDSPPSMSVPPVAPCGPPRTSASKSVSPLPLLTS